ncbi:MAG: phosphonate lyase system protein PhnH [Fibrobacterota bacterium]|jgi:alpha-D-ribose 1-methylphosphonate 5-triphosphate synthase subunit PhnH
MEAMSRPGTVHGFPDSPSTREACLDAVAGCLLDSESSLAGLDAEAKGLAERIAILTRSPLVPFPEADFVVVTESSTAGNARHLRTGSPDWPDATSTLLWLVDELHPSGGTRTWKGPGILGEVLPRVLGVIDSEWDDIRLVNSSYPLGIDIFFLDRNCQIMAIPRSTRIQGATE